MGLVGDAGPLVEVPCLDRCIDTSDPMCPLLIHLVMSGSTDNSSNLPGDLLAAESEAIILSFEQNFFSYSRYSDQSDYPACFFLCMQVKAG